MAAWKRQENYIQASGKSKAPADAHPTASVPPRSWWSPRIAPAALLALAVLAGCGCAGPRLESVAGPSPSETALADAGIRLIIALNVWSGFPSDLSRYFTPLAIRIENQRSEEVQVRYEDFVVLDDDRNQYRAVPPTEVTRALTGSRRFEPRPGEAPPSLLAVGPWPWYPYRDPFFYPYSPYGYYGPYWWPARGVQDILTLALREGRILPGASIQGFLYVQLATARGNFLTLSWIPRDPDGNPLATLSTQFRIVR